MTSDDFPVFPSPFFAGLVTARFAATWDFYTEQLGFRTVTEGGGGVRLMHPCGAQLCLLQEEIGTTPAALVSATRGRGLWLTLEVADAAAEKMRFSADGLATEALPENGAWPADAFAISDPNGVLVIITPRSAGRSHRHRLAKLPMTSALEK
jgi:catechol 2,3-dioxygenase-like lactoylglutathione lyase family enzyme